MNSRSLLRSVALSLAVAFLATACSDNSTNPNDDFKGAVGFRLLTANGPDDVTPDGSVALIENRNNGDINLFHVATGVLTKVTQVNSFQGFTTGISSDLRVSANYSLGTSDSTVAAMWSQAAGWVRAPGAFDPPCGESIGGAMDISSDGHTMVGFNWNDCHAVAFRWTDAGGSWLATQLEHLGTDPGSNRASVVSDNGLVAGGFASTDIVDRWPAIWNADGTGSMLVSGIGDDAPGEVLALSPDGSIAAGVWGNQAFYSTGGLTTFIPAMPDHDPTNDNGSGVTRIAQNGQLMFGFSRGIAFVWTAAAGMRNLQTVAKAAGAVIPPNLVLISARAASTDGTVVIGQAATVSAQPQLYAYVLKLPVSAYGL